MGDHSPHVELALIAIEEYVNNNKVIEPPKRLLDQLREPSAAFVSLKKYGELRGCIGTVEPTRQTLAHEIVYNGICAATRDPRFFPVECEELPLLTCSVDVLAPPEPIEDPCCLDPIEYGVIVECGMKRGLLLPNLEGVDTVEEQLDIARRKACIRCDEPVKLYRFKVCRFH